VIHDKEQGQGPGGRGHSYKAYFFRKRVLELDCEDSKVMLRRKRAKHRQMATPDGIVAGYFVIKDGDAQRRIPCPQTSIEQGEMFLG
jgi:hypothetical protein